jgi:hypothetical protein
MSSEKNFRTGIFRGLVAAVLLGAFSGCALQERGGMHQYPEPKPPAVSSLDAFVEQLGRGDIVLLLKSDGRAVVFDETLAGMRPAKDKTISVGSKLKHATDLRFVEGSCILWVNHGGGVYTAYELPDSHPYCQRR